MENLPEVVSEREKKIQANVPQLLGAANALSIWDEESAANGTDIAKLISESIKIAEDERKAIVKPFNDGVKAINGRFKTITEPLEQALGIVKGKILGFQREQEKLRRQQAEEARKAAEASAAPIVTPVIAEKTRGALATSYTIKTSKYRVKDISKVRLDLLMVNDAAVKALMKQGVREEAGIEFYEEESVGIR